MMTSAESYHPVWMLTRVTHASAGLEIESLWSPVLHAGRVPTAREATTSTIAVCLALLITHRGCAVCAQTCSSLLHRPCTALWPGGHSSDPKVEPPLGDCCTPFSANTANEALSAFCADNWFAQPRTVAAVWCT